MSWLLDLRLIPLFSVYLTLAFLLSTARRVQQYRVVLGLVFTFRSRWPKLFGLVKQHGEIFLTWGTVAPLVLSLGLLVTHTLTSWLVYPQAADYLTVDRLIELWPTLPVVVLTAAGMIGLDVYSMSQIAPLDRAMLEKYFDQAEYWLKSWAAPAVHFFTFGYVNPRKIVAVEVRSALLGASRLLNSSLWWTSLQAGSRLAFGLSLWGTFFLHDWLGRLLGVAGG